MLTFEKAMELTRTIGSHTSFEDEECEAYYDVLVSLEPNSLIVEIGLEYGRSSSIALQVACERDLDYLGIDPFEHEDSDFTETTLYCRPMPTFNKWLDMSFKCGVCADGVRIGVKARVLACKSSMVNLDALGVPVETIHALLIDGDHSYDGVTKDLHYFAPLIPSGGYLLCHDYERDSLPEVHEAVNDYMRLHTEFYKFRQAVSLGIWRRM